MVFITRLFYTHGRRTYHMIIIVARIYVQVVNGGTFESRRNRNIVDKLINNKNYVLYRINLVQTKYTAGPSNSRLATMTMTAKIQSISVRLSPCESFFFFDSWRALYCFLRVASASRLTLTSHVWSVWQILWCVLLFLSCSVIVFCIVCKNRRRRRRFSKNDDAKQ